jgi:hypothetical protein
MSDYQVLLCNATDDTIIGELVPTSLTFTETLNDPGTATITAALNTSKLKIPELAPLLQSIFVLRDGVPVWGGILWAYSMDVANNAVTLSCSGFTSLLNRRRMRATKKYVSTDQALIVKDIVDTAQAISGGDMLIDTSPIVAVGRTRDRTYYDYERKNIGEAIEQLSDVRDGFDYAIRPAYVAGVLTRRMTVNYPNTGRKTTIVLDAGSNVDLLTATSDATQMTTVQHVKGEGDGADALLVTATNAPLLNVYPMVENLYVANDVKITATLDDYAQRGLDLGKRPVIIPTVNLDGGVEPRIGSYTVGDQVRVRAAYGLLDIDDTFRITSAKVTVADVGSETVTLTLAPLEVFSNA